MHQAGNLMAKQVDGRDEIGRDVLIATGVYLAIILALCAHALL